MITGPGGEVLNAEVQELEKTAIGSWKNCVATILPRDGSSKRSGIFPPFFAGFHLRHISEVIFLRSAFSINSA